MRWIMILIAAWSAGCNRNTRQSVPRPELKSISIDSIGGRDVVQSSSLTAYIDKYGMEGWIAGLSDNRPLLRRNIQNRDVTDLDRKLIGNREWRIKDVVYLYYTQLFAGHDAGQFRASSTYDERDRKIDDILREIKKTP